LESYTPQNLINYWQNGKSIEDAMWELSDSEIRNQIPKSVQIGYLEWRNTGIKELYNEAIANECYSAVEMNIYLEQVQSQINDMLKNVYEKIRLGELIALGFQYPIESNNPSPIPIPIPIPIHVWPPESEDIDKSAIESNGFKYVNIRIIERSSIADIADKGELILSPIENPKEPGRPSTQPQIKAAYQHLKEKGKIHFNKNLKPQIKRIRETIAWQLNVEYVDEGYGEQAIRNAIGEDFKKNQIAHKLANK
jgi:hypothetical protein